MRYFTKNGAKAKTELNDKAEWLIAQSWQEVTEDEWNAIHIQPAPADETTEILNALLGVIEDE